MFRRDEAVRLRAEGVPWREIAAELRGAGDDGGAGMPTHRGVKVAGVN